MNIEEINNKIQAENDSYNRNYNRLQQDLLKLKSRHERIISDLKRQKQQISSKNENQNNTSIENLNQKYKQTYND